MELSAFFLIGLLGSLHCIGMCGPIVLALPSVASNDLVKKILYHMGRIVSYSVLGSGAGFIGSRFFISGLQQYLSILTGAIIILYILMPFRYKAAFSGWKPFTFFYNPVKKEMRRMFNRKTADAYFYTGLLNGLLPCGFVYMTLASSALTGTPLKGGLAMALFGIGTVPALFSFSVVVKLLSNSVRVKIRSYIPALALILGIILILRGLNLGIPYLSPKIPAVSSIKPITGCCE